jgi:hypothetical protein
LGLLIQNSRFKIRKSQMTTILILKFWNLGFGLWILSFVLWILNFGLGAWGLELGAWGLGA